MPATGFKAKRQPVTVKLPKEPVPMTEVMRLARNAAGLAMKGKAYSHHDRADAAAEITLRVWQAAREAGRITSALSAAPTSLGGQVKMGKGKKAKARPDQLVKEAAVPAKMCTMKILYGHACNLRRGLIRDRERQSKLGALEAREHGFVAHAPSMAHGIPADPREAHEAARGMLGELGLARLGKAYPMAYAAAREAAGMTGDEIAAELGTKRGTLVSTISRQAAKVPSGKVYSYRQHADALHVDEHRDAVTPKDGAGLAESMGERQKPEDEFPNTGTPTHSEYFLARYKREHGPHAEPPAQSRRAIVPEHPVSERKTRKRQPWNGRTAAAWTADLHPATRARLHRSAMIQRGIVPADLGDIAA
jgi:hypothetical protein